MPQLVNDLHAVNSSMEVNGFGPQLLCSLAGFQDAAGPAARARLPLQARHVLPVRAAARYGQRRDNPLELRVKAALTNDLRIEQDLNRWFPLWGAPGL